MKHVFWVCIKSKTLTSCKTVSERLMKLFLADGINSAGVTVDDAGCEFTAETRMGNVEGSYKYLGFKKQYTFFKFELTSVPLFVDPEIVERWIRSAL